MIIFVSDLFVKDYIGGGELSTQTLIETSLLPVAQINSKFLNVEIMEQYKHAHWVFGNFTQVSLNCLVHAIKNLSYTVVEYDYKFCKYRSIEKHIEIEGKCECQNSKRGKLVSIFLNYSKVIGQLEKVSGLEKLNDS